MEDHKIRKPLPPNRTLSQLLNHYRVEKEIADRIKAAPPEARKSIYASMYDELFARVPDHPRLTKRADDALTAYANQRKFDLIKGLLQPASVFVEFGCGDGRFTRAVAEHGSRAYGLDISDQRNPQDRFPDNFQLILYDGQAVPGIKPGSVDLVFSDYLIEHIHPDETLGHFKLVHSLLKDAGLYIFRTPHAFSGPEDISGYFSDVPQGFHLKEYTCRELIAVISGAGYSNCQFYWEAKNVKVPLPPLLAQALERLLQPLPGRVRRGLSGLIFPKILCHATR